MEKITVLLSGLDGQMAREIALAIDATKDMELLPVGLKGPSKADMYTYLVNDMPIKLFGPNEKRELLFGIGGKHPDVAIDSSRTETIRENVEFYTKLRLPFVMATTLAPGDMEYISDAIAKHHINAFVATNFSKEVYDFQEMLSFIIEVFPNLFKDFKLQITDCHPKYKEDVSGTAKTMIPIFNKSGFRIEAKDIIKKRKDDDYAAIGIPPEHWAGHSHHEYAFKKKDGSIEFKFSHTVLGRKAYVDCALDAIRLLYKNRKNSEAGFVYGMEDLKK